MNGTNEDRDPLPFGEKLLNHVDHICLLGSHLTSDVSIRQELKLHMDKRYKSVIKFYNFIRSNKLAPLKVKLSVLRSCVFSSLLYNCETFGSYIPKDIDIIYLKLLKCCLNVRSNVPNDILFIESGFLPIKSVIILRQFKFFKRFRGSMKSNSRREKMFNLLSTQRSSYLQHYHDLVSKFNSPEEIVTDSRNNIKQRIRDFANAGRSKYCIYVEINPDLKPSPVLDMIHPSTGDIVKFRLGSHYLPIETGRWNGSSREERICTTCEEVGDEKHVIYRCSLIKRDDIDLDHRMSHIWNQPDVYKLFKRIKTAKFL